VLNENGECRNLRRGARLGQDEMRADACALHRWRFRGAVGDRCPPADFFIIGRLRGDAKAGLTEREAMKPPRRRTRGLCSRGRDFAVAGTALLGLYRPLSLQGGRGMHKFRIVFSVRWPRSVRWVMYKHLDHHLATVLGVAEVDGQYNSRSPIRLALRAGLRDGRQKWKYSGEGGNRQRVCWSVVEGGYKSGSD